MQQYQQFWHNKYSHLDSQFQLDYDTFITLFAQQIKHRTAIQLTQSQKQIIKKQIDPENQNQVYKNGYLLFVKNFWGIASQRTRFFNMKINLSKLRGSVQAMEMVGWIRVKVQYQKEREQEDQVEGQINRDNKVVQQYLIEKDKISLVYSTNKSAILKKQQLLPLKGFIKIGSSPQRNDIIIPNSSINTEHIKLIYSTNLQQHGKSTASFQIKPVPVTRAFIRDISHSNRTRYIVDNENKYFVIKSGMVIQGIGLLEGLFQIVIDGVGNVQQSDVDNLRQNLNADRKSYYIGQADKPIKSIINYDMDSITEAQIIDLYDRNLYYPEPKQKLIKSNSLTTKDQKSRPTLKFRLINKRTLQQTKYDSKQHKILTFGRDPEKCQIVIDHISIRPIEFTFQNINEIWFIRRINGKSMEKLVSVVSVNLSRDKFRCSNRLALGDDYPEKFIVKGEVIITIQIKSKEYKTQDDY